MHRTTTFCIASLLAVTAVGCSDTKASDDDDDDAGASGRGGSGATGGSGGAGARAGGGFRASAGMGGMKVTCPEPGEVVDPLAMIDDLEDGEPLLPERAGRSGGWWTSGDGTLGATMVPEPVDLHDELAPPEMMLEERCGSHFAMRVTGQGFTDWGSVLGMAFVFGERPNGEEGPVPYDASAHQGIEFWARVGDTSTNQVRYQVSDSNSEPDGEKCVEGGGDGLECYDSFGTDLVRLDTIWQRYRLPFVGLGQRDFGLQASGVITTEIYQVTFNFPSAAVYDFWVDDIAFY